MLLVREVGVMFVYMQGTYIYLLGIVELSLIECFLIE